MRKRKPRIERKLTNNYGAFAKLIKMKTKRKGDKTGDSFEKEKMYYEMTFGQGTLRQMMTNKERVTF